MNNTAYTSTQSANTPVYQKGLVHTIVVAVVVVLGAGMISWNVRSYVRSAAVDGCIQSSFYQAEFTTGQEKTTSQTPVDEWYALCMQEKGYETRVNAQR